MLNIVIPMAGRGSRFAQVGFTDPKPFISIAGVPMIELVINNLRPSCPHRFIFICQQAHLERYDFAARLESLAPDSLVISVADITDGALCSVLSAAALIDNSSPLMIANSDQWVNINIDDYLAEIERRDLDGFIMTMSATVSRWSYVNYDEEGWVSQVVEKEVVSSEATVGIYNFRSGRDFCRLARSMVARNERSQGEFYVAPVYTHMYREGLFRIGTYNIGCNGKGMHGLGTPEDLAQFMKSKALKNALEKCEATV